LAEAGKGRRLWKVSPRKIQRIAAIAWTKLRENRAAGLGTAQRERGPPELVRAGSEAREVRRGPRTRSVGLSAVTLLGRGPAKRTRRSPVFQREGKGSSRTRFERISGPGTGRRGAGRVRTAAGGSSDARSVPTRPAAVRTGAQFIRTAGDGARVRKRPRETAASGEAHPTWGREDHSRGHGHDRRIPVRGQFRMVLALSVRRRAS